MADETAAVEAAGRSIYESLTPPEGNPDWEQLAPFVQFVFKETAQTALQAAQPHLMEPGRYWRMLDKDGEVWCESSSETEVRSSIVYDEDEDSPAYAKKRKKREPFRLQRHFIFPQADGEWRDVE